MREMDRETFIEKEVKPAAAQRLVRSLVLEEFARRENIEVKEEEIQSVYHVALQQIQQSKELKKLQSRNKQNPREMANSLVIRTVNSIFNQRLMSRLKAIATGKLEETTAFSEGEGETAPSAIEGEVIEAEAKEPAVEKPEAGPASVNTEAEASQAEEIIPADSGDENA